MPAADLLSNQPPTDATRPGEQPAPAPPAEPQDPNAPRLSAACARGKHNRCHGTVYVWPPNPDKRFDDCQCREQDCWHANKDRPLPHH